MSSFSILIPAYNEGERILNVLKVLRSVANIDSIIVVDDGSKDNTSEVVQAYITQDPRIKLIRHKQNMGKGHAIMNAWRTTTAPYILMLDADLIGLTPDHVNALCEPVFRGKCDMTLGLFKGGNWKTDFSHWATPWLTGQRCLGRDMLQFVSDEAASGYGLETAMTVAAHQQSWRVLKVPLYGMSHPISEVHRGGLKGVANRIKMYSHVLRAWYIATAKTRSQSAFKLK